MFVGVIFELEQERTKPISNSIQLAAKDFDCDELVNKDGPQTLAAAGIPHLDGFIT